MQDTFARAAGQATIGYLVYNTYSYLTEKSASRVAGTQGRKAHVRLADGLRIIHEFTVFIPKNHEYLAQLSVRSTRKKNWGTKSFRGGGRQNGYKSQKRGDLFIVVGDSRKNVLSKGGI